MINKEKIVHKPWGKEVWLELNDRYCYKRIYIDAGMRTSFQYHEKKLETNYIIDGMAEVWLENDEGEIEKFTLTAGDFFTVQPPQKHRVIAITDIVLQEVSTPEVDDVIRIQDDIGRSDGKIDYEHRNNAVCILMAGTGNRMGYLSQHINKGLLPVDNKAIVSHILNKIPIDYEIVIALGYKKELVREYCEAAHPERKFVFVDVGDYVGEGTGPSYSIDKCREYLQRPFYLITADTLIDGPLPPLSQNWLGVSRTSIPELYSTVKIVDDEIKDFKNKSTEGFEYAFIGLGAIYDFETFWKELEVSSGEVVSAFYEPDKYENFAAKEFNWYDLGTIDNYFKAKDKFEQNNKYGIIKTNGEFLYKIDNKLIKIFPDTKATQGRIQRQAYLRNYTPQIDYRGKNIYSYEFIPGQTLYEVDDPGVFQNFLTFARAEVWGPATTDTQRFRNLCEKFYKEKTIERLGMFLEGTEEKDFIGEHIVNGRPTRPIMELMKEFDWEELTNGIPTSFFHGDLQFDNILYSDEEKYYLIDWRQDFGGAVDIGDVYYDLAKLYGGTLISYSYLKDSSNFSLKMEGDIITYDYKRNTNLEAFRKYYERWLRDRGYDVEKIKKMTAMIFLNMAPLHEKELGYLLFFMFKKMMEEINDK
tara:strand:+ start:998 stop:2926 length:1929 start_codon:yes stop_codon:yes gene_type:complete